MNPSLNNPYIAVVGGLLMLAAHGAGAWSVDGRRVGFSAGHQGVPA